MELRFSSAARSALMSGIDKLADTVKGTLGPRGRNVAIYQKQNVRGADFSDRKSAGAHVLITNDGVTVAKSIVLPDPQENMGAQLLKEVAIKTNEGAGDGTTTAAVLCQAMLKEAFKNLEAGAEPMALRRGMRRAGDCVLDALRAAAQPITSEAEIARVATISSQEELLGELIGKALYTVGAEGVITVDESQRGETKLEIQEGIVFDRGLPTMDMATDEKGTMAELHDPYILLCDVTISNPQDVLPFLILAAEAGQDALIISESVEGEALGLILENKKHGDMNIVCVNAPEYGEGRRWRMEDLAVQTGGTFITKDMGMNIRDVTEDMVGRAGYVKVTRQHTVISNPGGDPQTVAERVAELRHLAANTDYEFNRERFKERLAKFVSGVAKLQVGGRTEPEIWERKMRAEDAVNAARAAYAEGVLPGGGVALLNTVEKLRFLMSVLEGDVRTGVQIVEEAVKAPSRQILLNAGLDGISITEKLLDLPAGMGFDMDEGEYVDMCEKGILDPLRVTRLAFENALSVAVTVISAEAGVSAEHKEEK
ncbi:MAG: molecular chaperone GroEL [Ruminococcaceae bacterium]|nr:molecular chaperone GroEL [Oscillospiraceae bacterium]